MIRRECRHGGEGEERGLRKGAERKFEVDKDHRHLPLLVVQLPQGTAFLLSSRLNSVVKAAICYCYNFHIFLREKRVE